METKVNKQFKDRLFCLIFGTEENKENALKLYNALNDTNFDKIEDIEITTIDDVIYIKMKNDVSLLIDGRLDLWEQQSTINKNMPLRGFMYFGNLYSKFITQNRLNLYGSSLIEIPTPQYYVFYNGAVEMKEPIEKLKLSNAFKHKRKDSEFEWTATVINLNKGKNDDLLEKCRPLQEYMVLINRIRDNTTKGMKTVDSINNAVDSCIHDGIMKEFLIKHKAEVLTVCLTEFDEKVYEDGIREEGRKEGALGLISFGKDFNLSESQIIEKLQEKLNISKKTAEKYMEDYKKRS